MAVVWLAVICSVLCVTGAMTSNICPVITGVLFGSKELNSINPIFSGGAFWGGAALATQIVSPIINRPGDAFGYRSAYLLTEAVKMGADAVGAIPHFEFTREYSVESVNFAMELAYKYDKLVDVHCDEIDDEASRGLETVATRALELGLFDKVTASHTTAMHSYNNAYVLKLMRLLKMSRINFVANPLVNTHLQGRADTYPKRRGVTRVKELLEAGINVSFGHDDIFDPWYPLGNGNLRDVVFMGLHVCQLMGYEDIMNSYRFITHNAAKTLHITDRYGIEPGKPASFVVMDATDYYDALNRNAKCMASYMKGGKRH